MSNVSSNSTPAPDPRQPDPILSDTTDWCAIELLNGAPTWPRAAFYRAWCDSGYDYDNNWFYRGHDVGKKDPRVAKRYGNFGVLDSSPDEVVSRD